MGNLPPLRLYSGTQGCLREAGSGISVMASSSAAYSGVASVVTEAVAGEPDAVEYPERNWVAQSVWHGVAVRLATEALDYHFRDRDDVLVAMELAVYYKRGDDHAWLQPDVQVVFGVGRGRNRSTYKVWEEGKAPDFVLEVASPSTVENDALHKAREYAAIGVREYWRLDPEGSLMGAPLEGYRAKWGRYDKVDSVPGAGEVDYLRSSVLGLDLRTGMRNGATVLVIRDPLTGEEFHRPLEASERQRKLAEEQLAVARHEARAAKVRASAAEEQLTVARDEVSAARDEASTARDKLGAAEKRIRLLEQRFRDLTGQTRPTGRTP